jgi:hypothetical protein
VEGEVLHTDLAAGSGQGLANGVAGMELPSALTNTRSGPIHCSMCSVRNGSTGSGMPTVRAPASVLVVASNATGDSRTRFVS